MTAFFQVYMALWGTACLIAMGLMIRLRSQLEIFHRPYWTTLLQGWKVATFLISATAMVVIAPYTGDPTWDYADAAFMSILAYTTAPWTVGVLYLVIRKQRSLTHGYIALCVWMFSASWSYDLYLVLRDGMYPSTWLVNIFASSVLYVSAGLFWNLEHIEGRGVIFGFMDSRWPSFPKTRHVRQVLWYALPLMVLVTAMIVPFLL